MTASEVRDRLDQRFRLLVGSRRGLERHQTLRHAVAWSYDLLDDAEKTLLDRCSVFAGGFDLESACAVAGSDDRLRHPGSARRAGAQVAAGRRPVIGADPVFDAGDDPPVRRGTTRRLAAQASEIRAAHARYFAGREADILALWDSPRQREAYDWFTAELANLRTAFRWAADHGDLDVAATIATYAALLGVMVENYEPDSLGRRAHRARPRRRPSPARVPVCDGVAVLRRRDGSRRLSATATPARWFSRSGRDKVPSGFEGWLGGVYTARSGSPNGPSSGAAAVLARGRGPVRIDQGRTGLRTDEWPVPMTEAMAVAKDLIDAAEAIAKPVGALIRASGLRHRLLRRRSRPRA